MATPLAPGFRYSGAAQHRLSYNEVKRLAQAYGLPGDAIAQIAKGESSMYADVQQHDPGDSMVGYGLLQMTPNAWGKNSAAYKYMQGLGGITAMRDPAKNMAMARFLYKAAGNKLTPWYGTRFLTNRTGEGTLGPVDPAAAQALSASPVASNQTQAAPGGNTTRTIPGQSFAPERAAAIQSFLDANRNDPGNNLDFAMQIRGLQDTPSRKVLTRTPSVSAPPAGTPEFAQFAQKHSPLLELIHNTGSGPGFAVKNGQKVDGPQFYSSVWAGHRTHVHVAAGPKTVVELGKLAQKMGLKVGENPHFGGVDPVHVPGSYHYKGEAIDVSGDPKKMDQYASEVERLYGIR